MKNPLILIVLLLSSSVMAEDWSAQLQSPIPALREKAEKQLIEMGPNSGVVLPDANQPGLPADVKRRIERIRRSWDERNALSFLEPSSIENLPTESLHAWLEAAEKKTGNPIDFKRLDDKLLGTPIESPKSTEFWKAMDELAQRYSLNYSWFERPKAVRLGKRQEARGSSKDSPTAYCLLPTACYPGAFRFEMQEWGTTVRLADPSSSTIRTGLILAWEPRLRPIYIDILPKMQYADGTVKTGESIQILAGEGAAKPIDFIFPLTSENGKKAESLSGDLSVVIAGEQKTFTFPIPADGKPQTLRQDQAVVVLKSIGKAEVNNSEFGIRNSELTQSATQNPLATRNSQLATKKTQLATNIAVEFDESYNGLRSYMTWLNYNKAYAVDSEGKRYPSTSWETVWQSDRGAEAKYYFTVPSDAKIRQIEYLTPTAIRRIDYSFKFEEKFSEKF